jgi:phosphoserine phosphatase RsbU/P
MANTRGIFVMMSLHSQQQTPSAIMALVRLLAAEGTLLHPSEFIQQAVSILSMRLGCTTCCAALYHAWGVQAIQCGPLFGIPEVHAQMELSTATFVDASTPQWSAWAKHHLVWIIPLRTQTTIVGHIALSAPTEHHSKELLVEHLTIVGGIIGTAVAIRLMAGEATNEQKRLGKSELLVSTLVHAANDFTAARSREQTLRTLQYHTFGRFMISRCYVFWLQTTASNPPKAEVISAQMIPPAIQKIADITATSDQTVIVGAQPSTLFEQMCSEAGISLLVPIKVHGVQKGAVALGTRMVAEQYSQADVDFFTALASMAMAAFERNRLQQEEIAQEVLRQQLQTATEIQQRMLPHPLPSSSGVKFAARMLVSQEVGGDYYDVIPISENETIVAIADVTGKGIPASLVMAAIQAALHVLVPLQLPLDNLVTRLNSLVFSTTDSDVFVTMVVGILDARDSTFRYVNAGHNPPMLITPNGIEPLTIGGPLLGIIGNGCTYRVGTCALPSKSALCLYTDGVTEARNDAWEEFGEQRLQTTLTASVHNLDAETIIDNLLGAVHAFRGNQPLPDDTTVLTVSVTSAL